MTRRQRKCGMTFLVKACSMTIVMTLAAAGASTASAVATLIAGGLDNPSGSTFGPDGSLYVAERGRGGDLTTTIDDRPGARGRRSTRSFSMPLCLSGRTAKEECRC